MIPISSPTKRSDPLTAEVKAELMGMEAVPRREMLAGLSQKHGIAQVQRFLMEALASMQGNEPMAMEWGFRHTRYADDELFSYMIGEECYHIQRLADNKYQTWPNPGIRYP